LQRWEPSINGSDYIFGFGFPDEWLGLLGVVLGDESVNGCLQVDEGMEHALLEPSAR